MVESVEHMFIAVQMQNWDNFAELTAEIEKVAKNLQSRESKILLNAEEISEKKALIEKYLAIDLEVKAIVESRKAELAKMIESTATKDKVNQRYGSLRTQ